MILNLNNFTASDVNKKKKIQLFTILFQNASVKMVLAALKAYFTRIFFPFSQLLRYFAILKAGNISRDYLHCFSANNSEADNTGKALVSI